MKNFKVTYVSNIIKLPFKKSFVVMEEMIIQANDRFDCVKKCREQNINAETIEEVEI